MWIQKEYISSRAAIAALFESHSFHTCRPQKFRPAQQFYSLKGFGRFLPMSHRSRSRGFLSNIFGVFVDLLGLVCLSLRTPSALAAENLFLRKQLGLYVERKKKPRRATDSIRFTLILYFEPRG
jgi:hypothetical protein